MLRTRDTDMTKTVFSDFLCRINSEGQRKVRVVAVTGRLV